MEKEITTSATLGVVLIALAAVVGLGFGIFSIAKGVLNDGQVAVIDTISNVEEMVFMDFNQSVVTGNRILAFYDEIKGSSVALLVNTNSMSKGVQTSVEGTKFIQNINNKNYINYNALLSNDGEGDKNSIVQVEAGKPVSEGNTEIILLDKGVATSNFGFATSNKTGKVSFNNDVSGWVEQGSSEYIGLNTKFESNLIKDNSGGIIGVFFTQID